MHSSTEQGPPSNVMSRKAFPHAQRVRDGQGQARSGPAGAALRGPTRDALALLLIRHEVRSLRRRLAEFERDILLPILLGEIALHNVGALELVRDDAESLHEGRGGRGLRPCNTYSLAAAIDLPRETVRRKVGRLIEYGWVERRDNGHLFVTVAALKHFGQLLVERELPELLEVVEQARRYLDSGDGAHAY